MSRRKRLLSLFVALVVFGISFAGQQFGWFEEPAAKIGQENPGLARFVDGDTITVAMASPTPASRSLKNKYLSI
jgi:hypothetical protein